MVRIPHHPCILSAVAGHLDPCLPRANPRLDTICDHVKSRPAATNNSTCASRLVRSAATAAITTIRAPSNSMSHNPLPNSHSHSLAVPPPRCSREEQHVYRHHAQHDQDPNKLATPSAWQPRAGLGLLKAVAGSRMGSAAERRHASRPRDHRLLMLAQSSRVMLLAPRSCICAQECAQATATAAVFVSADDAAEAFIAAAAAEAA